MMRFFFFLGMQQGYCGCIKLQKIVSSLDVCFDYLLNVLYGKISGIGSNSKAVRREVQLYSFICSVSDKIIFWNCILKMINKPSCSRLACLTSLFEIGSLANQTSLYILLEPVNLSNQAWTIHCSSCSAG